MRNTRSTKRSMDSDDSCPPSAKRALRSSAGNSSTQSLIQYPVGEVHRIIAHVQPIKPDPDTNDKDSDTDTITSTEATTEFNIRLKCPLGDMWQYRHQTPRRWLRDTKTGNQLADTAIDLLDLQGFTMQCLISHGHNALIMAHSTSHARMIAIKFIVKNVRKTMIVKPQRHWEVIVPNEVIIHKALKHKNIVEYIDYQNIGGCICLLLEYCGNGSLSAMLDGRPRYILPEAVARKYYLDILNGLTYLHGSAIAHRNIKCENLLLDTRNHIKICDFGFARKWQIGDALLDDHPGTEGYQAPEVVMGTPHQPFTIDVWSSGCVLYKIVFGELPYSVDRTDDVCDQMNPTENDDSSVHISSRLRLLLAGMLHPLAQQRFTLNRIRHDEWTCQQGNVYLGAFYRVGNAQKCDDGSKERQLKEDLHI